MKIIEMVMKGEIKERFREQNEWEVIGNGR